MTAGPSDRQATQQTTTVPGNRRGSRLRRKPTPERTRQYSAGSGARRRSRSRSRAPSRSRSRSRILQE
ncbi:hypothetical protein IFM47457_01220 [Aspergillus lentulus]|nr:hypothetical protein IFM47457_01220 [Aspergillus lentulus]